MWFESGGVWATMKMGDDTSVADVVVEGVRENSSSLKRSGTPRQQLTYHSHMLHAPN